MMPADFTLVLCLGRTRAASSPLKVSCWRARLCPHCFAPACHDWFRQRPYNCFQRANGSCVGAVVDGFMRLSRQGLTGFQQVVAIQGPGSCE